MENEERDLEAELKEETDRFHNQNQEAFDKKVSGEQELEDRAKERELKKTLNDEINPILGPSGVSIGQSLP